MPRCGGFYGKLMAVDPQQNLDANQPGEQLNLLDLGDMVPPRQRRQLLSPDFVPDPIVEQPFAEPPFEEFQVAGGGKGSFLVNLFKIFGAQRRIPRVPTLIEESRPPPTSPEGKPLTYIQQRDQAQEQALSPEGLERVRTERAARLAKQEEALSDPEGVMATARQAFSYEAGARWVAMWRRALLVRNRLKNLQILLILLKNVLMLFETKRLQPKPDKRRR